MTQGSATIRLFGLHISEQLCGFESAGLCGWHIDNSSDIAWYWHDGADEASWSRMRALRYDHTYGSSKHIGMSFKISQAEKLSL